jgi:7-carboxy-7-deazaguanine synthase
MIYRVNEIFKSRQGEGFNQGKEVVFLRLAGCNLTCVWCDTNYHPYTEYRVEQIMQELETFECKKVLITGGEPSAQNLTPILKALKQQNYWTAIETNGTISLSRFEPYLDYISLSPKKQVNQFTASELRVVNDNRTITELLELEQQIQANHYFISPLEENGEMNIMDTMVLVDAINSVSENNWRISIQLHKLAGIR